MGEKIDCTVTCCRVLRGVLIGNTPQQGLQIGFRHSTAAIQHDIEASAVEIDFKISATHSADLVITRTICEYISCYCDLFADAIQET
ncbi:hypothetical protein CODIS_41840 [Candidatus Thiodiazotropha endolucinida]|uniref:Uncharacterized protein n=1 Tax=Candidatus Thiodiazotropha endolucinida TaxID=1655433 RepID=A0A7Z1AD55_9GAMM|nr:hypothetical protein CODIS_41840 [Candidatus Thiodiazotropha endolucinida]